MLQQIATKISNQLRESDLIARVGGDEFVILLPELATDKAAEPVASSLISLLNQPFTLKEHQVTISASIGISKFPNDGDNIEELINHADKAMYKAKEGGKNSWQACV